VKQDEGPGHSESWGAGKDEIAPPRIGWKERRLGLVTPVRISVKYHLFEGFDSGLQGADPFFKIGKGKFEHRSQFFFHFA
jgi:hypothetical protein